MKKPKRTAELWQRIQFVEHVALLVLLVLYITGLFCKSQCQYNINLNKPDLQNLNLEQLFELSNAAIQAAIQKEGPQSVLNHSDVQTAPIASMTMDTLKPGQFTEFHDDRGDIYKFKLSEDVSVNMYKTTKGFMRSGDLHNCTQYDIALKGKAVLTIRDLQTGKDEVVPVVPFQLIVLPPRMPHMFEFLEDNYLLEWWSCDFQAWYYPPFRSIIDAKTKQQREQDRGEGIRNSGD